MEASEHRYRDDLSSLSTSMRRACWRRAWRPLSYRPMRAPVVEIADILGQDLLQMALIEYENVVQALGPDRSHPALGDGVGSRRSEWRAGQYQHYARDDRKWCHNSCRGHGRGNKPVLAPKRSIRQFAAPSTKRSDAASRERGRLVG